METIQARVLALDVELIIAQQKVETLSRQLKIERQALEEMCSQKGHSYIEERIQDYHSSRNGYTCSECGHFTMIRPSKYKHQ